MKVQVQIRRRSGVLDPEGRAISAALRDLGYVDVAELRVGKLIELELPLHDPKQARAVVREMCEKLLANPIIEDYEIRVDEVGG